MSETGSASTTMEVWPAGTVAELRLLVDRTHQSLTAANEDAERLAASLRWLLKYPTRVPVSAREAIEESRKALEAHKARRPA